MLAIGSVGSRLKYLENKHMFEMGFLHLLEEKTPHTLVVVGSANYPCFDIAKRKGVQIIQFDGDTASYHKQRKQFGCRRDVIVDACCEDQESSEQSEDDKQYENTTFRKRTEYCTKHKAVHHTHTR